jgi:hypothetical protein
MSEIPSPEARAGALVIARSKIPGGPWFVELRELVEPAICLGPYQNPSIAQEDAGKVRAFLAAVIRESRGLSGEYRGAVPRQPGGAEGATTAEAGAGPG